MNPTNSKNPQLGIQHNSLPAQGHSLSPANVQSPEINKAELSQAQGLAGVSQSKKSIHNRQPEVKQEEASGLTKYELLADLPPELIAHIVKDLSQKDLSNFFYSIHPDLIAVVESKQKEHWSIRLLDAFLNQISVPINFDKSMFEIIDMAKCLGIQTVFSRVPSMCIDFSRSGLSYKHVRELFKKMSIGVKQLELYGIEKKEVDFSKKYFPQLESLKVGHSKSLESLEVDDESGVLKELNIYKCPSLKTIDIQYCDSLNRLDCLGLVSLEAINMVEKNQLKELTLKDCDLDNLDLYNLASFLSESCVKLNLKASTVKDPTSIKQFISKLRQLREIHLMGINVSLKNLCALEKITLESSPSAVDLSEYTCAEALKELIFENSGIKDIHCLSRFTALESLNLGYKPDLTQRDFDAFAALKKLKSFSVRGASGLQNLDCLIQLSELEKLALGDCKKLTEDSLSVLAGLTNLKELYLGNFKVENVGFLRLLSQLEALSLCGCNKLTQLSFDVLGELTRLKKLDLTGAQVKTLDFLEQMRNLEVLVLDDCLDLTPESFNSIAGLKKLKYLGLSGIFQRKITISLSFFEQLSKLEVLDLSKAAHLSDENCSFLAHLKNLKTLKITGPTFWDDVSFLKTLTQLEDLTLAHFMGSDVIAVNLEVLNDLLNLRRLNLVSIHKVKNLSFKGLKNLEYINLKGTGAFQASSPELADLPSGCQVEGLKVLPEKPPVLPVITGIPFFASSVWDFSSDEDLSDSE